MVTNHYIEIDGIPIEIVRKPIKNIHLRVYPPHGSVKISAPLRLPMKHIYNAIEIRREWLHAQRKKLQSFVLSTPPTFQNGEYHYYLGNKYILRIVHATGPSVITLQDNELVLQIKPEATYPYKQACLKRWYQKQMQALLPPLIKKWQSIIDVTIADWGIKTMKTRWGSCNTRAKRIWLNLVLIQKNIVCIEYVLVHEMVHLHEASHNARFYQLMDTYMPDWRNYQNELNLFSLTL